MRYIMYSSKVGGDLENQPVWPVLLHHNLSMLKLIVRLLCSSKVSAVEFDRGFEVVKRIIKADKCCLHELYC